MKERILYLGVIGAVVVLFGTIFLPGFFREGEIYDDLVGLVFNDVPKDTPAPENSGPGVTGRVSGGDNSEDNGGNSDSGGDNSDGGGGCYESQISYSIQNFVSAELCEDFFFDVCIHKRVSCSLEAYNFDGDTGGDFGIRMYVVENGFGIESAIDSEYQSNFIYAGMNKTFEFEFSVLSQGVGGNANKDLECLYVTEEIPQKQICP